jgi:hypothetical protein
LFHFHFNLGKFPNFVKNLMDFHGQKCTIYMVPNFQLILILFHHIK